MNMVLHKKVDKRIVILRLSHLAFIRDVSIKFIHNKWSRKWLNCLVHFSLIQLFVFLFV